MKNQAIINIIADKEKRVIEIDEELARERNRTRPNVFLIKAREHERNNCFKMLRVCAEEI